MGPIGSTSLTSAALSLTDNGGANLITSSVPISLVSDSTYEIGGLSGLTAAEGTYTLTVNGGGIQDPYGNSGSGTMSTSWLMDTTPPTSTVGSLPAQTTSTSFSLCRSVAPTRAGRTAVRRRASRRSPFTPRPMAGPSPSGPPSRPPIPPPSSLARPATLTDSTAWRPTTRGTSSRPQPQPRPRSRSSRR